MADHSNVTTQNGQTSANEPQAMSETAAPVVIPEVVPLPDVLRQIGRDSRRNPEQYLDETIVPFGGE